MNGDFSRDTSERARLARYTRVLLQQGRPLLDADFNEQSAIHHDYLRMFIADNVGRGWRPTLGAGGFNIKAVIPVDPKNFKITKGHFYVDGILCDNPEDCSFSTQPYLPNPTTVGDESFIAFIECWERHVCSIQRPELREIALGGPDTASRAQIVWQVHVATSKLVKAEHDQWKAALHKRIDVVGAAEAKELNARLTSLPGLVSGVSDAITVAATSSGDVIAKSQEWFDVHKLVSPRLRAMAKRDTSDNEACSISPDSIYRGRENQLYRVEIHDGGTVESGASFKWSRENGSVLFAVRRGESVKAATNTLTVPLETLGHDRRTGLCVGDWVEVSSDAFELDGLAPPLGQITQIDRTHRMVEIQIDNAKPDFSDCTLLRRWDQTERLNAKGTVAISEATDATPWIALERGVQIQFQPGGVYRNGDYWLIPARVASGDVIWPRSNDAPSFIAADGIARHRTVIGRAINALGVWAFDP